MKLYLEDLVTNAIIELYRHKKIKKISAIELQKYTIAVKKYLENLGYKIESNISKEEFLKFKEEHQNTILTFSKDNTIYYLLQDDVTIGELIDRFRNDNSIDNILLDALTDQKVLESLEIYPTPKKSNIHIITTEKYLKTYGCPICKTIIHDNKEEYPCPNKDCNAIFYTNTNVLYNLIYPENHSVKDIDIRITNEEPPKIKKLTIQPLK